MIGQTISHYRILELGGGGMSIAVFQATLNQLARLLVQHRHLLVARVQITSYNLHVLGSFPPSLGSERSKSTQRLWSRTRLSNQPSYKLHRARPFGSAQGRLFAKNAKGRASTVLVMPARSKAWATRLGCKIVRMNEEENAAVVIKEGVKQLFAPYGELLNKLLGPAATELGGSWADSARVWRWKRQVRLLQEVKRFVEQSGKDIKPIATRLFFPVLEAASIEDDDEMQTRWAALLANESTDVGSVQPSFIEILKQMAPGDARLLDKAVDWCESRRTRTIQWWVVYPRGEQQQQEEEVRGEQQQREEEALENLVRLRLVVENYDLIDGDTQLKLVGMSPQVISTPKLKEDYTLSDFAIRFVRACRAPQKKED
jgi:Abortive infection alpha/Protein of unknown function (DUF2806)